MRVEPFPSFSQSAPVDRLVSMLNEKAEETSPLKAAQRALLAAKAKLEDHRDERIEQALDGYLALRSRQTSYEEQLRAQQNQLEDFQALTDRYDALSAELASAKAACAAAGPDLRQSLRVSALEDQLAAADQGISCILQNASRYANGQRQYAAYLEKTGQNGYAAFEYLSQPQYTRENFVAETSGMIDTLEAGAGQWQDRVSSYCEQFGLTPYDFECYLQERNKLADACFAAQQRLSGLLHAAGDAPPERSGAEDGPFDVNA